MLKVESIPILWLLLAAQLSTTPATAAGPGEDWADLQSFLPDIKGTATAPIPGVQEAIGKYTAGMLMGNGDIGVVAGGATNTTQKFYFAKNDFWGTGHEAARNINLETILSAGSLVISSPSASIDPAPVYRMEQRLLDAEVGTTLRLGSAVVTMRSWAAATENVFVTELSSPAGAAPVAINCRLAIPNAGGNPFAAGIAGPIPWTTRENTRDVRTRIALAMNVLGAASTTAPGSGNTEVTQNFTLNPGAPAYVVVVIRGGAALGSAARPMASYLDSARARASALTPADIAGLQAAHRAWWKDFWLQSYVRINDRELEKFYYGGLYSLGCAARQGKLFPSMWGPFVTVEAARWGGRHYLNYNAEAPYYGLASSNRPELILPYSEWVVAEYPHQVNKTHSAGYLGCTFSRSHDPYDIYRPRPSIGGVSGAKDWKRLPTDQKSNGTFAALPLIMYWEYTKDTDFLRSKLYPLLKELDAFWRDYVDKTLEAGGSYRYVVNHSGAHETSTAEAPDVNPNLDIGYIRTVCRMLIKGSKELNVDANLLPAWQDMLDHLSPYPTRVVNGKECFTNAENGKIDYGNQPVNMEGAVHPGENVTLGADPKLVQIGLNTVAEMASWGRQNNGFCKVWPIAARLGWPADDFIVKFKKGISDLWRESNLTAFQGGGGLETSGSIDAVNSMLLQSNFEVMRLFPVWPANKDGYFKRLRAKGAFVVSSSFKSGSVEFIDILSEKGSEAKVLNPWTTSSPAVTEMGPDGNSILATVKYSLDSGRIVFATSSGKRYRIAKDINSGVRPGGSKNPVACRVTMVHSSPPVFSVALDLGRQETVALGVFDLHGREIKEVSRTAQPPGRSAIRCDLRPLGMGRGVYVFRVRGASGFEHRSKFTVAGMD